jgi:hypothetical protein
VIVIVSAASVSSGVALKACRKHEKHVVPSVKVLRDNSEFALMKSACVNTPAVTVKLSSDDHAIGVSSAVVNPMRALGKLVSSTTPADVPFDRPEIVPVTGPLTQLDGEPLQLENGVPVKEKSKVSACAGSVNEPAKYAKITSNIPRKIRSSFMGDP